MSQFKAGDFVRVKEGGWGFTDACIGDIVTLKEREGTRWYIEEDYPHDLGPHKNYGQTVNESGFELWRPKVGEVVRILDVGCEAFNRLGTVIVDDNSSFPFRTQYTDENGRQGDWWCLQDEVAPAVLGRPSESPEEKEPEDYVPEVGDDCQISIAHDRWDDVSIIGLGHKCIFVCFHDTQQELAFDLKNIKVRKEDPVVSEREETIRKMCDIIESDYDSFNRTEIIEKLYNAGCRIVEDIADEE